MNISKLKLKDMIKEIIKEEVQKLQENRVRLSTMKDANFEPGRFVQIVGKNGMVKLDKKSVHKLAKIVRSQSKGSGMGWSFTAHEGKLTEGKSFTLPNGVKVNIEFKGLTFVKGQKGGPVFLDRKEMLNFFKATAKYLK